MMYFTITYQSTRHPRTQVLLQKFASRQQAIAHCKDIIGDVSKNCIRALIREGEVGPEATVVWDSNDHTVGTEPSRIHQLLDQAIVNRLDNLLADLESMTIRVQAIREDVIALLKKD